MHIEKNDYINEARIEVLKDALKDSIDTIRAQDNKASYIIAFAFFIITGFVTITNMIFPITGGNIDSIDLKLYSPLYFFLLSIFLLFLSYHPVSNPVEVLISEDKELGKNKFFSQYQKDKERSSEVLATEYFNITPDVISVCKIIYIEIIKLSKIRERKISYIKMANKYMLFGSLISIIQVLSLYKYNEYIFWFTGVCFIWDLLKGLNYKIDEITKIKD